MKEFLFCKYFSEILQNILHFSQRRRFMRLPKKRPPPSTGRRHNLIFNAVRHSVMNYASFDFHLSVKSAVGTVMRRIKAFDF